MQHTESIQKTSTSMYFDLLIIGAGPAGLSAAIRLGQLNQHRQPPLSICVIEKGARIGSHIISGAILEPQALDALLPNWKNQDAPMNVRVNQDRFYYLTSKRAWALPSTVQNKGCYLISLSLFCQWLGKQAEALGITIITGCAADKILYDEEKQSVIGVQTKDMGLTQRYQPGLHLYAKQTILSEGCRGSLSETVIQHFQLRQHAQPPNYAIGIKELWEIPDAYHRQGTVIHTIGWPLKRDTYGGGFIYHHHASCISIGIIIGLDYKNPYLDPFQELQRLKTHPLMLPLLQQGQCIEFGARALNEGGLQSMPELTFPGGLLLGCSAGFMDVAKHKGIHNAIRSGMIAADTLMQAFSKQPIQALSHYEQAIKHSPLYKELYQARNRRPAFYKGLWRGMLYTALDHYFFKGKVPWTFPYRADYQQLMSAQSCKKINYPEPDGKITFDKLTQLSLSGVYHRENEPSHLKLKHPEKAITINFQRYDGPEQYYCPAQVYEIIQNNKKTTLKINATHCIHCKTCDIKDPTQNIVWSTPEGGEGPNYSNL